MKKFQWFLLLLVVGACRDVLADEHEMQVGGFVGASGMRRSGQWYTRPIVGARVDYGVTDRVGVVGQLSCARFSRQLIPGQDINGRLADVEYVSSRCATDGLVRLNWGTKHVVGVEAGLQGGVDFQSQRQPLGSDGRPFGDNLANEANAFFEGIGGVTYEYRILTSFAFRAGGYASYAIEDALDTTVSWYGLVQAGYYFYP